MAELVESSFSTRDRGEAEAFARLVYPRTQLRESEGDLRYEHTTRGADGINFTRFKVNSRLETLVEFERVAAFGVRVSGRYAAESNRRPLDPMRPFLFAPGPGTSTSQDIDILMVDFDLDVLAQAAAEHVGADSARLRFHSTAPVSEPMSQHWLRTIGYAWNSVMNVPEVFHRDMIRTATLDVVTAAALASFNIEVDARSPVRDSGGSAAIRRAAAFIDDNAHQPLTAATIASAARLSVRGLQLGFQRDFGMTPMAYLRAVRLEAARAELLAANAGDEHVVNVARRWAFANPGRFAAQYRARFGERPTDTLRG